MIKAIMKENNRTMFLMDDGRVLTFDVKYSSKQTTELFKQFADRMNMGVQLLENTENYVKGIGLAMDVLKSLSFIDYHFTDVGKVLHDFKRYLCLRGIEPKDMPHYDTLACIPLEGCQAYLLNLIGVYQDLFIEFAVDNMWCYDEYTKRDDYSKIGLDMLWDF